MSSLDEGCVILQCFKVSLTKCGIISVYEKAVRYCIRMDHVHLLFWESSLAYRKTPEFLLSKTCKCTHQPGEIQTFPKGNEET